MPPPNRTRTTESSGLDYVGRGFWFALGFTPVFIVLTTLATYAYMNIIAQGADASIRRSLSSYQPPRPSYNALVNQATQQAQTIQREATQLLVPRFDAPVQDDSRVVETAKQVLNDSSSVAYHALADPLRDVAVESLRKSLDSIPTAPKSSDLRDCASLTKEYLRTRSPAVQQRMYEYCNK
jgi:hypothetical protein